jgi:hypothetical protein
LGYQVLQVDYTNDTALRHAVMGVHTIISTITGEAEVALIKAAGAVGVRRFAPAEFEGPPSHQLSPAGNTTELDPLDHGKRNARAWLSHYPNLESTVFVCGVLYERFAPGGLHASFLGLNAQYGAEGDYLINVRNLKATAPCLDVRGTDVKLCLTAAQDVAALVVKAIGMPLGSWLPELRMVGARMTVSKLLETVLRVRGSSSSSPVFVAV